MIGFDPEICELCGGFGECADGNCDEFEQIEEKEEEGQ